MAKLKKYQKEAVLFTRNKEKVILNMGCRTGKTITSLCCLFYHTVVVIGPPHLKKFWLEENKKLLLPKNLKYYSRFDRKGLAKEYGNYNKAVILDEAHENMKWSTNEEILKMCKRSYQTLLLTATPFVNNPLDLYWPLKICGEWEHSKADFTLIFCGGQRVKNKPNIVYPTGLTNQMELKKMIKNTTYTYFREEKVIKRRVIIGEKPLTTPKNIQNFSSFQKMQGFLKSQNKTFLNYLKKRLDKSGKIGILFFHKEVGRLLKDEIEDAFLIDGGVPIGKRHSIIKSFEKSKKGALLLNYKSCGVGIDVKTVDVVIFAESTWSPAKDYQAYMRFYGHEREKPLKVVYPVFEDEERLIVSKRKEQSFLMLREV